MQANHAGAERLVQHLRVGGIVAEIRHNQCVVVVAPVDRRQCTGARASEQALRQLFGLADPK